MKEEVSEAEQAGKRRRQVDSFTRPPQFRRGGPLRRATADVGPVGSRFILLFSSLTSAACPSGSGTTGSRIPFVSAAGTTNRQRVEKLRRPSSTSFLIRLSLRSVDQTKESEKRPTTSEFQEPLAAPCPLFLFLSSVFSSFSSFSLRLSLFLHLPSFLHLFIAVFLSSYSLGAPTPSPPSHFPPPRLSLSSMVLPTRRSSPFAFSPSVLYRREYRCCLRRLANCTTESLASASIMRLGSRVIPLCFMR